MTFFGSPHGHRDFVLAPIILVASLCWSQTEISRQANGIDLSPFFDSSHHWYDIHDENHVIDPLPNQRRYSSSEVKQIADNIVLFQRSNGGWPKNYDMTAILNNEQRAAVLNAKNDISETTFDNGATHSQVDYLAKAFLIIPDTSYRNACLRGIDFILDAQYQNGGWPQFYPDRTGYRRYITFNDGAMIGVMKVLQQIVENRSAFAFVDAQRRQRVQASFTKGLDCILRTQIRQQGTLTAWCQQHDDVTFAPRDARTFELASQTSLESSDIVLFLMSLKSPEPRIITAVEAAIAWLQRSTLHGIRVDTIEAPKVEYQYHSTHIDRVLVHDPSAPPVWARFYELDTNVPLFCNRDGKAVYSLAEVDRERRTGYSWYNDEPAVALRVYETWKTASR